MKKDHAVLFWVTNSWNKCSLNIWQLLFRIFFVYNSHFLTAFKSITSIRGCIRPHINTWKMYVKIILKFAIAFSLTTIPIIFPFDKELKSTHINRPRSSRNLEFFISNLKWFLRHNLMQSECIWLIIIKLWVKGMAALIYLPRPCWLL